MQIADYVSNFVGYKSNTFYMKKYLLLGALAAGAGVFALSAQNVAYTTPELGEVNSVSANGHYAAINDPDNNCVYLWNVYNPNLFEEITPEFGDLSEPSGQRVNGANAYGVTDDGMVVGCINYADGKSVPAYYKNGKWNKLDMPDGVMNTNLATVVTPDGKAIAGYCCHIYTDQFDQEGFGQYFPVRWDLDEDGEYQLTSYDSMYILNHDGFFPMCISHDGKVIGGKLDAGVASSMAALIVDGQLKYFHDVEILAEPWEYKGKWYTGTTADGVQHWTDDPNDPNIVLFESTLIDGLKDQAGDTSVSGFFNSCDADGNFYGCRSIVSNVSADHESGTVRRPATIYNVNTNEWKDNLKYSAFTCGNGSDLVFTSDDHVLLDDDPYTVSAFYHVNVEGISMGVVKCNDDAGVLGAIRGMFNEAIGDYDYFPYIIVTEDYTAGVSTVYGGADRASVILRGNTIEVKGTEEADLYDIDGHFVAKGVSFNPGPGMYVVKAGEISAKVLVK